MPDALGHYELSYNQVGLFTSYALGIKHDDNLIELNEQAWADIEKHNLQHQYDYSKLCDFNVLTDRSGKKELKVYLRIYDQIPVGNNDLIQPGINQKPLKFSWFTRNNENATDIQFRYKLIPEEKNWSPWVSETEVFYYFIPQGNHLFELECRYRLNDSLIQTCWPNIRYVRESQILLIECCVCLLVQ